MKLVLALMIGTFITAFTMEVAEQRARRLSSRLAPSWREARRHFLEGYRKGAK